MWLVEGLEGERFALISKTHHSLVDGVPGVDLATVLFDLEPNPGAAADRAGAVAAVAGALRRRAAARGGARHGQGEPPGSPTRAVSAATRPASSVGRVRDAAEGLGEIVWAGLNPAPETPLNVEIGPHRRFAVVRQELADYKRSRTCSAEPSTTSC